jgi:GntR family transcriptional regulator
MAFLVRYGAAMVGDPYPFRPDMPLHVQIAAVLQERILSGEIAPGLPIPSDLALTQEFGVARDTARKAVALLRGEGYVCTVKGRGSSVRDRDDWPAT